jgi:hypothetical protein
MIGAPPGFALVAGAGRAHLSHAATPMPASASPSPLTSLVRMSSRGVRVGGRVLGRFAQRRQPRRPQLARGAPPEPQTSSTSVAPPHQTIADHSKTSHRPPVPARRPPHAW